MAYRLTADDMARYAAAGAALPNDLMDSATDAFAIMTFAATHGDRDVVAAATVVLGDTCLQICVAPATTKWEADDKARFLALMVGWAWPREPVLGAVLEASRRAEVEAWGLG
jgi:hypothetical protein